MKTLDSRFSDSSVTLPVVFVVVNLSQLPVKNPAELDQASLLDRVASLERQMAVVYPAYPSPPHQQATSTNMTYANAAASTGSLDVVSRTERSTRLKSQLLTVSLPPPCPTQEESCDKTDESNPEGGFHLPSQQVKKTLRQEKQQYKHDERHRPKPKAVFGTKQDTLICSAQRRYELFVFRVHQDIEDNTIQQFLEAENIKVHELEVLSRSDAWTKSYRVLVEPPSLNVVLKPDFWPDGIGCRRFWKKKS